MDNENIPNELNAQPSQVLAPFDYHHKVKDHFKGRKKTWDWFKEEKTKHAQIEEFKTNLLKNTYRLERTAHEALYLIVDEVVRKLSIDASVTLYQEHNSLQLNAGISIIDKEAHIVLSGNLINLLTPEEMKAVLAHELSHYLFYKVEEEEFEITQRIILSLANDHRSEDAFIETARIFQLYMELFCDAGALMVCNDYKTVIQSLVKIHTGIQDVNAESYLAQAREIIKNDGEATLHTSHPESYIRSIALFLRHEHEADFEKEIENLIEGELDLDKLDIFSQVKMQEYTDDLIQLIVKPRWMNSSAITNLCMQYFKSFNKKNELKSIENLAQDIQNVKPSVKKYFSYVLLDFAKVDTDMEGVPLGYTLEIAELLGIKDVYEKTIRKELKLTVRDFTLLQSRVLEELQQVKESKEDSIYNG